MNETLNNMNEKITTRPVYGDDVTNMIKEHKTNLRMGICNMKKHDKSSTKMAYAGKLFNAYAEILTKDMPGCRMIPDSVDISIYPDYGPSVSFLISIEKILKLKCKLYTLKVELLKGGWIKIFDDVSRLVCNNKAYENFYQIMLSRRTPHRVELDIIKDEYDPSEDSIYTAVLDMEDLENLVIEIVQLYHKYKEIAD